jgi:D-beta-D-heptose 7-phosphate kinase/D-beta-D-heptose 1-phosphate adenosyltransferase
MTELLHLDKLEAGEARIQQVLQHGGEINNLLQTQLAAVTLDRDGALFFERGGPVYRVYARPASHNRVAGAGDTFMSALTLALAAGADTTAAAELASTAAAIVVEKPGTSTCYIEELKAYFSSHEKYLTDNFQVSALVAAYHRQGKQVVFTNGCFDILHSGHIHYLNQAKACGDVLIVGVNSDAGVRRLKGENRPINALEERVQVLAGLSSVDHIISFDEDVPYNLIQLTEPDVYVKGGDYTREQLPEADLVEKMGGQVTLLPITEDRSTSSIIERIRQVYTSSGDQ